MSVAFFRELAEAGVELVYPDACQICREAKATRGEGYVCSECWRNVRFIVPPWCERCGAPFEGEISDVFHCTNCEELNLQFSSARSAVAAKGMVLDIIHRWKYSGAIWFEPFLSGLLIREARPALEGGRWDCIVPVPLHRARLKEREFNQAGQLAMALGAATGIPVREDLVRRVQVTVTQTTLSRAERARNVDGAFGPGVRSAEARGRRIVLIDDVLTTGATTSACAGVLRACGAEEVCVWTVARGLLN